MIIPKQEAHYTRQENSAVATSAGSSVITLLLRGHEREVDNLKPFHNTSCLRGGLKISVKKTVKRKVSRFGHDSRKLILIKA